MPNYSKANPDRFLNMDTEEEAYWLGWLYTDGCFCETTLGRTTVSLSLIDIEHVEKFAAWIGVNSTTRFGKTKYAPNGYTRSTASTASPVIADNLRRQGMHSRKTWTIKPWNGPDNLMRHFWRGAIEGDGTIGLSSKGIARIAFCGNRSMVEGFRSFVGGGPDRSVVTSKILESGNEFCTVRFTGVGICKDVLNRMYGGCSVWLDRKKAIVDNIMNLEQKRKRFMLSEITREEIEECRRRIGSNWGDVCNDLGVSAPALINARRRLGMTIRRDRRTK